MKFTRTQKTVAAVLAALVVVLGLVALNRADDKIPDVFRPAPAQGLTGPGAWFVTSSGNDANDGLTIGTAKRSVKAACDLLVASPSGGTVYTGHGTFTGPTLNATVEADALFYKCNKSNSRLTALDRFNPPRLVIADTQTVLLGINSAISDIEIDNMIMNGGPATHSCGGCARNVMIMIRSGIPGNFYANAVPSDIRIHDIVFEDGRENGIYTQSVVTAQIVGVQIYDNIFRNIGDGYNATNGNFGAFDHGVYAKSLANSTFLRNRCTGIAGFCIQLDSLPGSPPAQPNNDTDNVIAENVMLDNGWVSGGGIYLYAAYGTTIRNNLIAGNGSGIKADINTTTASITHNTVVDNNLTAHPSSLTANTKIGVQYPAGGYSYVMRQNLVQGNTGGAVFIGSGSTVTGTANLVSGTVSGGGTNSMTGTVTTASSFLPNSWVPALGASAVDIGTTLSPPVPTDALDAARVGNPDAGAFEANAPYTPAPLSTASAPSMACTTVGAAAAVGQVAPVTTAPTGSGITRTVTNLATFTAALGAANPGDRIVLTANVTLTADVTMSRSGTATDRIVIASASPQSATISGPFTISTTGNYVTWHQTVFTMGVDSPVRVLTDASHGKGVRISGNRFIGVGNGAGGESHGAIRWKLDGGVDGIEDALNGDGNGVGGTPTDASGLVDGNVFEAGMRNVPYWQDQYLLNMAVIGNTVEGDTSLISGETEAFKIGFGFGDEATNTRISYNTTSAAWRGVPYTIGVKSSSTTVDHNVIGAGIVMIRHGDANIIDGNCILNGSIEGGGDQNSVIRNRVVTGGDPVSGLGPLTMWARGTTPGFDGTAGTPIFYVEATNWRVEDNVFVSTAADLGSASQQANATADWGHPSSGNLFRSNEWYRPSGSSSWLSSFGSGAAVTLTDGNLWHRDNLMRYLPAGGGGSTTTAAPTTTSTVPVGAGCVRRETESMLPGTGSMAFGSSHAGYSGTGYRQFVAAGTYLDASVTTAGTGWTVTARYSSTLPVPATRTLYADYTNAFPNVQANQFFTFAPTGGAWASVTATLPSEFDAAGTHDTSISWNTFAPLDSGAIELDYLEFCPGSPPASTTTVATTTTTSPPATTTTTSTVPGTTTTLAGSRSVSLGAFIDKDLDAVRDPGEPGMPRTRWTITRTDTGLVLYSGRLDATSGLTLAVRTLPEGLPLRLTWYTPLPMTSAALVNLPAGGASTHRIGGCCAR